MMGNTIFPDAVQKYVDAVHKRYTLGSPETFHILHLYPKGLAYPDGYYDSQFFDLHCFNMETDEKLVIEQRDGLVFDDDVHVDIVRIFADGSTLIRFKHPVRISVFQAVEVHAA